MLFFVRPQCAGNYRSTADSKYSSKRRVEYKRLGGQSDGRNLHRVMGLADKKGISQVIDQYHQHGDNRWHCVFEYRLWDRHRTENFQRIFLVHVISSLYQ